MDKEEKIISKSYINRLGIELLDRIMELVDWYSKVRDELSTRDEATLKLALRSLDDVWTLASVNCEVSEDTIRRVRLIPPRNKKSKKTT